jgi:hypothetical protein
MKIKDIIQEAELGDYRPGDEDPDKADELEGSGRWAQAPFPFQRQIARQGEKLYHGLGQAGRVMQTGLGQVAKAGAQGAGAVGRAAAKGAQAVDRAAMAAATAPVAGLRAAKRGIANSPMWSALLKTLDPAQEQWIAKERQRRKEREGGPLDQVMGRIVQNLQADPDYANELLSRFRVLSGAGTTTISYGGNEFQRNTQGQWQMIGSEQPLSDIRLINLLDQVEVLRTAGPPPQAAINAQVVRQEPIEVVYANRHYGLDDTGEWVQVGTNRRPTQAVAALLDKASGLQR